VVAPILIGIGVIELDAIRVAAIANNAPVSFGALGAPIIALASVTGLGLDQLSASIGRIVAILALLPPWILIWLVSGKRGMRGAWPLALVGSFSYILGQYPTSQWLGPYLPDIIGAVVSFGAILLLLRYWRPRETLGFGGIPIVAGGSVDDGRPGAGGAAGRGTAGSGTADVAERPGAPGVREAMRGLVPFGILIVVVVAATGPWSHLSSYNFTKPAVAAVSSLSHKKSDVSWAFSPAVGGTWILVSWLIIVAVMRVKAREIADVFRTTFAQMWGALLVAPIIFGLADVFNYSGMANSMAYGFSRIGPAFLILAPIVGWIGVALSRVPGIGRRPAGHARPAAALAELGRGGGRQAHRPADRQRGRRHQQVRPPRGSGHQAQPALDARAAGLPAADRRVLPLGAARRDDSLAIGRGLKTPAPRQALYRSRPGRRRGSGYGPVTAAGRPPGGARWCSACRTGSPR
jgi:lactate permease